MFLTMDRHEKVAFGETINQMCNTHDYMAIINVSGVASVSNTSFRKEARNSQIKAFVVKNTISKIATMKTKHECSNSGLCGQNMIVFANDPVSMAKIIVDFSRKDKNFKPVGISDGNVLHDSSKIEQIALLPNLDGIRAMLLATIISVPTKLALSLKDIRGSIARLISTKSEPSKS